MTRMLPQRRKQLQLKIMIFLLMTPEAQVYNLVLTKVLYKRLLAIFPVVILDRTETGGD